MQILENKILENPFPETKQEPEVSPKASIFV